MSLKEPPAAILTFSPRDWMFPVPLPAGGTPASIDAILSEAERAVARIRNLARFIRARAIEDARGLPNGFNLTQTLEAWHKERVAHLLTAGIYSDAWLEALLHYASAIESAASLFPEWNAAAVRIAALSDAHAELEEDLQYLIGTVLTAERERREIG